MSSALKTNQTLAGQVQQISQHCLFRKIQRSPRPGLKQKTSRYPGKPKFTSQSTRLLENPASQTNCDTHGKINCLAPKVNPFFGSLLITIFQKQNYLNIKN